MQVTGRCHCGAISFQALVDPQRVMVCHCADCQVFSGAPYRAVLPTPAAHVTISGRPRHYVKVADSGRRRAQAFCEVCGTQLYACDAEAPEVYNLRLGCMEERAQLPPQAQIWSRSAMPWVHDLQAVPAHGQGPDSAVIAPSGD